MNDDCSPIYSSLAGDEDLGEIVALYADEMPERVAGLRKELEAGNRSQLQVLVHQLKGSAGSHGFSAVSAVAGQLDELLKTDGDREMTDALTHKLIDMCLRVRASH